MMNKNGWRLRLRIYVTIAMALLSLPRPAAAESQTERRENMPLSIETGFSWLYIYPMLHFAVEGAPSPRLLLSASFDALTWREDWPAADKNMGLWGASGHYNSMNSRLQASYITLKFFPKRDAPFFGALIYGLMTGRHLDVTTISQNGSNNGAPYSNIRLASVDGVPDRFLGLAIGYRYVTESGFYYGGLLGLAQHDSNENVSTKYIFEPGSPAYEAFAAEWNARNIRRDDRGIVNYPIFSFFCGYSL